MRLVIFSVMMLFFSQMAIASTLCGPQVNFPDAALKFQITQAANQTARSALSDTDIEKKTRTDYDGFGFQNIASNVSLDLIAAHYFRISCLALLGVNKKPTPEILNKLHMIASGLGNPQIIIGALNELDKVAKSQQITNEPKNNFDTVVEPNKKQRPLDQDRIVIAKKIEKPLAVPSPSKLQGFQQALDVEPAKEKVATKRKRFRGFNPNGVPETRTRGFNAAAAKAEKDCETIGEIGGCSNLEDIIKKLKEANLKYNHPTSMYLGRKTQVSLILETTGEDQSKELSKLQGSIKSGKSKISRFMQAELSGASFQIEPSGPQRKTITSLEPVKWTWYVTPLEDGNQKRLNLELAAILREATRDLPPVTIKTFKTEIHVDVGFLDLAIHRIKSLDPVYKLATAVGGIASALLLLWRIFTWGQSRARRH